MKFFQKKHSVCAECGVHFEPVTGYEARWGQFCAAHRTERRQNDEKKDAVLAWAAKNWARLQDQMAAEYEAEKEKRSLDAFKHQKQAINQGIGAHQQMDNSIYRNSIYNQLGGFL